MNTYADVNTYKVTKESCPYCNIETDVCDASLTSHKLGVLLKAYYCGSDNYDNCAIFLAKSLRRGY